MFSMEPLEGLGALRRLGLSENEARVYAALCEEGAASAERLSRATRVHRRSVYDGLSALVAGGLATTVFSGGRKMFASTGASSFFARLDENRKYAEEFLRECELKRGEKPAAPVVRVFAGKQGIKAILDDVIREGKTFYNYGGAGYIPQFVKNYFPQWDFKRCKAGILLRCIFTYSPELKARFRRASLTEVRFIPRKYYSFAVWWLYANKLALVFWGDAPFAIVVESGEFAKTYRNFFSIMWRNARS